MRGGEDVTDFEKMFCDNREFIFKYLLKLTRNYSLAEELMQETFFRAYMNFSSLRNPDKAPVWLCRIAKNTYYAWYNEQKRIDQFDEESSTDSSESAEEIFIEKELSSDVLACLRELDEPYKEVFTLSVLGDLTLKEISTMFGKSESWARVTYYRAKQKLKEKMR